METPTPQNQPGTTVIIQQPEKKSNGMGITGFVFALIALFFGAIPFLGWLLWLLGLIFSIVGLFKKPKGLAIAGLIISVISIIVIVLLSLMGATGILSFLH